VVDLQHLPEDRAHHGVIVCQQNPRSFHCVPISLAVSLIISGS
jgi:hypothetical protein